MFEPILRFRQRLAQGQTCVGASITFSDALVSDALADSFDFFWIDLEHSAMSPEVLQAHFLAARAHGVPALVRVPGSGTAFIKPILDSGASGIIVPQVRSAAEVRAIVGDCRYPPVGQRGYGPRVPSNYGRDGGADYIERANRAIFVAVQIENRAALAAIDEIVAVPGLDSIALGPWDLSASLGLMGQVEHPEVQAALDRIIQAARAAGLFVGSGMGADARYAEHLARRGVQWLQVGGDYNYMLHFAEHITADLRARLRALSPA
ncbi:MAG: 4-hydroxy-3-methylbut-2-en-1-yl diphosphate synthase [Chloroflexi bacterium]|nr:4-hydroxy-3-methylbut-2-en-1-yl diphosphate synthase [Chloroflexota bacterium]